MGCLPEGEGAKMIVGGGWGRIGWKGILAMRWKWWIMVAGLGLWAGGCVELLEPRPEPQDVAVLSKLRYPAEAPLGEDLDILVVQEGRWLRLVNRLPQRFEKMQLWLNRQYVGQVEKIEIGTENLLELRRFINEYGEAYPAGGFLQPDKAFPVVMAELYDPQTGQRHRLLVRRSGI